MVSTGTLIAHTGARLVERWQVMEAPTPPADAGTGWTPLAHGRLLAQVEAALLERSLLVTRAQHALYGQQGAPGTRWFAVMDVRRAGDPVYGADYGLVLGVRNSHDRRFAAGLTVGSRVFVCDNLAFSGEVVLARKHTRFIERDLAGLVARAFGELSELWLTQAARITAYKAHRLHRVEVHDLVVRMVLAGVFPAASLPVVLRGYEDANRDGDTAWALFNAVTGLLGARGHGSARALPECVRRTTRLHGLLDVACGITPMKEIGAGTGVTL